MTVNSIPNAGQPIAGGMRVDPTWYKWLRELDREARDTGADLSAEIQAIARKLGSPDGTIDGIPESSQSLTALPPLTISGNQITLSTLTADTAGELFGISRDAYGRISALRPVVAGAGITIDGTTDPNEIAIVNSGLANPMTTAGDLIRGGVAGAPERLAIGADTQVLTVVSGAPAWAAAPGGLSNPMTTAEDLIKGGASGVPTRLAVGTNGHVLTVTSGVVGWAAPSGGGSSEQLWPSGGIRRSAARKAVIEWPFGSTTAAPSANNYVFHPFVVGRTINVTALGIELTAVSAGNRCRVAIYANTFGSGNDAPGSRLVQTADISTATPTGYKSSAATVTLSPGTLYWVGFVCSAGSFAIRSGDLPMLGRTPDANLTLYTALSASAAGWTEFPATAPAVTPSTLVGYKVITFFEE